MNDAQSNLLCYAPQLETFPHSLLFLSFFLIKWGFFLSNSPVTKQRSRELLNQIVLYESSMTLPAPLSGAFLPPPHFLFNFPPSKGQLKPWSFRSPPQISPRCIAVAARRLPRTPAGAPPFTFPPPPGGQLPFLSNTCPPPPPSLSL